MINCYRWAVALLFSCAIWGSAECSIQLEVRSGHIEFTGNHPPATITFEGNTTGGREFIFSATMWDGIWPDSNYIVGRTYSPRVRTDAQDSSDFSLAIDGVTVPISSLHARGHFSANGDSQLLHEPTGEFPQTFSLRVTFDIEYGLYLGDDPDTDGNPPDYIVRGSGHGLMTRTLQAFEESDGDVRYEFTDLSYSFVVPEPVSLAVWSVLSSILLIAKVCIPHFSPVE